MSEYFYGAARKPARTAQYAGMRPVERRGVVSVGRIVKLLVGQGHGFIRLASGREVFFHRSDLGEETSINELVVGDAVTFELLEDAVSGARAQRVKQRRAQ